MNDSLHKPHNPPPKAPAWRQRLVRIAPWALTAVVVSFILLQYPLAEIAEQVRHGHALLTVPIGLSAVVVTLLIVAWADLMVVRGCCGDARYIDVLGAKAGSSLLDIFGYAYGHSAYAVWILRFTRVKASLAAGAMLYIANADLISVCAVASAAGLFAPLEVASSVLIVAPLVFFSLCALLLLGPYQLLGGGFGLFKPWVEVPRTIGFKQIGLRILQTVFWVFATWIATRAFGLNIPLSAMCVYFPIIMLVGALPINVANFGAVQGAWLLLSDYESGTRLLAFHFVWTLVVAGGMVLRGLPFVRRVVHEVDRSRP